jgi:membrane fusion protein (multidrug efflux system)
MNGSMDGARSPMLTRLLALATALGPAGLLSACGGAPTDSAEAAPAAIVVMAKVAPVQWRDTIEALGTARANESVTLTAKVSETVRKVAFDSGDIVRAGDVIVDLSSGAQLAGLEEARAAFQEAERQLARGQELAETKIISQSQLDTQRSTRDAAKARMDVVRAQLADRVITAPFDGILGLRRVSPGSLVTPGTEIATLDDISVIKLDFSVPERHLAIVETGQDVIAHSETYPDRDFTGKVASVDSRVDPVTRSVAVRAEIPNPQRLLRPGMLLSVRLYQAPRQAIVVPEIAVIQVGTEAFVYRVADDSTASRVKVALGARRRGEVEIVSGLAAGDTIVTEGAVKLRDGTRVAAAPAAQAAPGAPAGH